VYRSDIATRPRPWAAPLRRSRLRPTPSETAATIAISPGEMARDAVLVSPEMNAVGLPNDIRSGSELTDATHER